ncbi:MAG TPA: hypothetical protein VKK31_30560 [Thermoanaerobaculia bacterium]|nr:hypothetical protein [Thermoanaerobaculia bacterium]
MPDDVMRFLRVSIQAIRGLGWLFLAWNYMALFFFVRPWGILFLTACLIPAAMAYVKDKEREARGMDDFRGDWLFFRYGEQIHHAVISIPVKPDWEGAETLMFAETLRRNLARRLAGRLPPGSVEVLETLTVVDNEKAIKKDFLRMVARSTYGSMVTHFVHYAPFGQTISAHYFTYLRGSQSDWALMKFVLTSPFTIWLWGGPWLLNRHSILASLSHFHESSFDGIELATLYSLTHEVVYEETLEILDEFGLLTENVKQQIIYQIQQKIEIKQSSGVSIGNVKQGHPEPFKPATT